MAQARAPTAARNKKDVEQLLQKIDRVEAAISSAEAMGHAAKQQLDAELGGGTTAPPPAAK